MVSIAGSPLPTQAVASPIVDFTTLKTVAANTSSSIFGSSSFEQILRFPFRFATRVDHVFVYIWNNYILATFGLTGIAGTGGLNAAAGGLGAHMAEAQPVVVEGLAQAASESWAAFFAEAFQASTFKSYWGMLHYLTSRWAFTCFAMALILNRIGVYGASRQRIRLTWSRRLALRIVPILLLSSQVHNLLQAIRCQTSPEFSLYRHGDNNKYSLLDWSTDGGSLHTLTSTLLFRSTDADACAAVSMSRPEPGVKAPRGSFSLLWPAFLRLSLAHAVESLSTTLQQIPSMTEVGMSVFEHSLAFAEAETMISHTLGLGLFGNGKSSSASKTTATTNSSAPSEFQATIPASGTILAIADATTALTSPHFLDRVNVPVEVLLVTLLSCSNALSSHVIAVLGKQRQWRLINTGIWGMAFMGSFVWGLLTTSVMVRSGDDGDDRPVSSLLHFPTVAIVGFLPHMCIIFGMWVCLVIYSVALVFTAVSLGTNPHIPQPTSFRQRFSIAHDNLQAAVQTRGINIRWYEDFYTALLRVGFAALTAASEAVFLNEGRSVEVRQFTWLEEDRLDEFETMKNEQGPFSNSQQFQILEEYGLPPSSPGGTDRGGVWESGFGKERKFEQKEGQLSGKESFIYPTPRAGGVGAVQRTTRFYLLMIYMRGILFLIGGYIAYGAGLVLDSIGITSRPRWLRKLVGRSLKKTRKEKRVSREGPASRIDNWVFSEDGKLFTAAGNGDYDIEPEMRGRLMTEFPGERVDELLDSKLYDWWKSGGWFGTKDESDDYKPPADIDNDDTTSMISMSTAISETYQSDEDDVWESEPEGQRTPTQSIHNPAWSFSGIGTRESTPDLADTPLDPVTLARLLNPQDKESRDQARILASHLASPQSSGIVTRSRYRREQESERAKILLAGRLPHPSTTSPSKTYSSPNISLFDSTKEAGPRPLTSAEEAEVLESLILNRRKKYAPPLQSNTDGGDANADDEANRQAGPPCVVCQTAARTIIAWPCRCLCVCEDCRVSLALNNFGNCVTCRRSVQGFVRLYVP